MTNRIGDLLAAHPVFDGHNDIAWALRKQVDYDLSAMDIANRQPSLHTDIPRLRAGGVGAQFFSVYVPGTLVGGAAVTATLEQIDCVRRIIARYPDTFAAARTATEVRQIMAGGRIAALMGAEGGHSIDSSLAVLRILSHLGVAYLTLTHNQNVPWADAAADVPAAGGLTEFGRDVVREMNRIGMLVDISHVAPTTMRDAIATSSVPVMFSHSSCRALTDHVRNAPDDVLRALVDNDGIVMITFVPDFVSQECADWDEAKEVERSRLGLAKDRVFLENAAAESADPAALAEFAGWTRDHPQPRARLGQVADHIEHAREVTGVRHLGIGGDYDGVEGLPVGLDDVSTYPALLAELADRGWSDDELAALTCGNALRVLQAAEDAAADHAGSGI